MRRFLHYVLCALAGFAVLAVAGTIYFVTTLYTPGPPQRGYLVLAGANVLVGEELERRTGAVVVVRDGSIVHVGDSAEIEIPSEATVLDLSGHTLMPGLIDLHVHLGSPELDADDRMGLAKMPRLILDYAQFFPAKRRAFLAHGITTVRSLGDDYGWVMEMRKMLRAGELEGPQLYAAGPMFTTARGHPVATIGVDPASDAVRVPSTPDEARLAVAALAVGEYRVDLIKVIQERGGPKLPLEPIAPNVLNAIVDEAHRQELTVVAHWGTLEDLRDVLRAGVDGLQHLESRGIRDEWPEEILRLMIDRDVSLAPTLAALEAATLRSRSPLPHNALQRSMSHFRILHDAGGRVVAASDAGMPGVRAGAGLHRELQLFTQSGLSPRTALRAATSEAAKDLGTERIGAIAPGRTADLVVLKGDPLRRIEDTRNVIMVFREGRIVVDRR
jgi:imidazolonepropionase-like amidohydrolase